MASLGATQGCSVAIIAGGSSRRMGTDKARLVVAGEPLLARLARQLHALGPLTIVGGDQSLLALAEPSIGSNAVIEHVLDEYPGEGPLGALITAMRRTAGTALALVACDLPDLDSGTVLHMLEQHLATDADVTVPVVHNAPQWHVTLWNPEVLLLLESCFSTGERSLWRAARALRTTSVVFADDSKFRDLDSPEDLAGYENRQPPGMSDSMGVYADRAYVRCRRARHWHPSGTTSPTLLVVPVTCGRSASRGESRPRGVLALGECCSGPNLRHPTCRRVYWAVDPVVGSSPRPCPSYLFAQDLTADRLVSSPADRGPARLCGKRRLASARTP